MKKLIVVIVLFVLLFVLFAAGLYFYTNKLLSQKELVGDELIVTIPHGSSLNECVEILNENGLFEPSNFFKYYFRYYSFMNNRHINAGSYRFTNDMDNRTILESLFNGTNLHFIKVTYPEGITINDFAEITEKKFGIERAEFISYINSPEILEKYGIPAKSAEGYLYPNTYIYFFNADLETVVGRLLDEQQKLWDEKFEHQLSKVKFNKHEILTLASIIEAETPVVEERRRVSGVYHNRLMKGMLLQADPTVAYALNGKKNLTYKDLKINSPYNTYLHKGLPPGALNSPSISSIEAALEPEEHDFLYFVAKGDSSNEHNFSVNYAEHLKQVAKYRQNLKKRY